MLSWTLGSGFTAWCWCKRASLFIFVFLEAVVTYELARLVVGFVWLQFEFGGTRSAATPDAVLPGLAVCRLLRQVAIFGGR